MFVQFYLLLTLLNNFVIFLREQECQVYNTTYFWSIKCYNHMSCKGYGGLGLKRCLYSLMGYTWYNGQVSIPLFREWFGIVFYLMCG
jgi:hypothetical protein